MTERLIGKVVETKPACTPRPVTLVTIGRIASVAFVVLLWATAPSAGQQSAGPQGPEEGPFRRQLWRVPSTIPNLAMLTTMLRPRGRGPFPLVVINHGSMANADDRAKLPREEFEPVATWFVQHGFAVALPQRPGHGETGGPYLEELGSCDNADYRRAGLGAAASILATMDYLTGQPFVLKSGVVLAGHSAGGWGALAAASQNPRALRAVINFAGGLGGHSYNKPNLNCAPDRLIEAAKAFGSTTRVPTLWLYAANDTYFNAALSAHMADAFRRGGGIAEYDLLPAFDDEGHVLMSAPAAVPVWAPIVARFLGLSGQ